MIGRFPLSAKILGSLGWNQGTKSGKKTAKSPRKALERSFDLEFLEDRVVPTGPQLVSIIPNTGDLLREGDVLNVAPNELLFRFNEGQSIEEASLSGIRIVGAGYDDTFEGGRTIADGATVQLNGSTNAGTFEFDKDGVVSGDNTAIAVTDLQTPEEVAVSIATAINSQSALGITATTDGAQVVLSGANSVVLDPLTGLQQGVDSEGALTLTVPGNSYVVTPGSIVVSDSTNEVVMRFAQTLADDRFEIQITGEGVAPLQNTDGEGFIANTVQTNYESASVPVTLLDSSTTSTTLTVLDSVDLVDLSVTLSITHPSSSDLQVFLTNPEGTRIELFSNVGTGADFTNTVLDDGASASIVDGDSPFTGTYQPVGSLSEFLGEETAGDWVLEIVDSVTGNTGTLDAWQLSLVRGERSDTQLFELDLGAQVTAIVPQPITRNESTGELEQNLNQIVVYLNDDELASASVTNPAFYQLINTQGTLDAVDDTVMTPDHPNTPVIYDATANTITLTFASPIPAGTYRLRIGNDDPLPVAATTLDITIDSGNSSFDTATDLADLAVPVEINAAIDTEAYGLTLPGGNDEPGHRDISVESHLAVEADSVDGITTAYYNFQLDASVPGFYGFDPQGNSLYNVITANQKQRVREIFELYGQYLGIQFVETEDDTVYDGITIVVGDPRVIESSAPTGPDGVLSLTRGTLSGMTVIDAAETDFGNSEYGGVFFQIAVEGIGHSLGLGEANDLPDATEAIFPGDNAILHGQYLYRPESTDIDLYSFRATSAGRLTAEVVAERLNEMDSTNSSSLLDAVLTLYNELIVLQAPTDGGAGLVDGQYFDISDGTSAVRFEFDSNDKLNNADAAAISFSATDGQSRIASLVASAINNVQLNVGVELNVIASATGNRVELQGPITLVNSSGMADSILREVVARNDDYFGKDAFLTMELEVGNYYIAVTSTGNTDFNPNIEDSGFGGTTQGEYQLQLNFTPQANNTLVDATGVAFDGDADGIPGGIYNFWFESNDPGSDALSSADDNTIYVDKTNNPVSNTTGADVGTLANPYQNIDDALSAANSSATRKIVRIVGNGGADGDLATLGDNLTYKIGFNNFNQALADGSTMQVPQGVTVMVDAGAVFKLREASIDVGSSSVLVDRSEGAIQMLGTPVNSIYMTSFRNDLIGGDEDGASVGARSGDWGGIVLRGDSDLEEDGIFLSYINHVDMAYGGGGSTVSAPIHLVEARPTVSHNYIHASAEQAISADPNSFEETHYAGYDRVGPDIDGNLLLDNSINGLFIRVTTDLGNDLNELELSARFDDADIVHIIGGPMIIQGQPGGPVLEGGTPYVIAEVEANNTLATAQDLDGTLVLREQDNIGDETENTSTTIPHITVRATGNGTFDYYKFTVTAPGRGIFDIDLGADAGTGYADLALFLYDASGTLLAQSDDAPSSYGAGGSSTDLDPFISYDFTTAGTYFIGVAQSPSTGGTGGITGNPPSPGATYRLHVSLETGVPASDVADGTLVARPSARLMIDPGVVVKSAGSRIEAQMGAQLIAEGSEGNEIIFTSIKDDMYGGSGTADTNGDRQPTVVFTELGLSQTASIGNFFEIQNLSDNLIDTSGWRVVVSDDPTDINSASPVTFSLPTYMVGNQLLLRSESADDPGYTGVDLNWASGQNGWAMILDDDGNVVDWVGWGWTSSQISSFNVTVDGVTVSSLLGSWSSSSVANTGSGSLQRQGDEDTNTSADFAYVTPTTPGTTNADLESLQDPVSRPVASDWGGLIFQATAKGSLDHAILKYGGGESLIEGGFDFFNVVEIHQADVRIANSVLRDNASGLAETNRNGLGSNTSAVIFVRGAQPVLIDNVIRDNVSDVDTIAAIDIDVNSLNSDGITDPGRSTGEVDAHTEYADNRGALVRGNQLGNNNINGMVVRGGTLTTEGVWDDTDIVHVVFDEIIVDNFHTVGGLRLESSASESLVVKLEGDNAGFTASGTELDIDDRIGGSVQILGTAGHPVVLTALSDDGAGAGLDPDGIPQVDTNNDGVSESSDEFPPSSGDFAVTTTTTGMDLVNAMLLESLPSGVTISGAVYSGGDVAAGTYSNGSAVPLEIWPTGAILTTGDAALPASNTSSGFTGVMGTGADADLDALIAGTGNSTTEAATLTVTIQVAAGSGIQSGSFKFQFGSDEYSEYVGSAYNDVLGAFINGGATTNFLKDAQGNLVSINSALFDIDNEDGTKLNFEYDGMTSGLVATFPLQTGTNTLKIAVADTADTILDSGILMTDLQFSSAPVGSGGIARLPGPGDWRSVRLESESNDRNVANVNELEAAFSGGDDINGTPETAQDLGNLAPHEYAGDENRRLGFQVNGSISFDDPTDVDVYSFTADPGTEVWFDIDRTSYSLDSVIELLSEDGTVLARSVSNGDLYAGLFQGQLVTVNPLQKDPFIQQSYLGEVVADGVFYGTESADIYDLYTTNPRDAGMRVILPGPADATTAPTYYVRVRSNPQPQGDISDLDGGLTNGDYQLQIRLREVDEVPGSVVRFADVRYADTGIEVLGLPTHSPLVGENAEAAGDNNTFANAQDLGNLLTVDRNTISVAGELTSATDVDWYQFTLNYDMVESYDSFTDGLKTFAAIFDMDYADGLARADLSLAIYDQSGTLIYVGRDSDIEDDQPLIGEGADTDDLSRGSFGQLDPYIGSVQLSAGVNAGESNGSASRTYYVAVYSDQLVSEAVEQFLLASPQNSLVRLEPINSLNRVAEDHVLFSGYYDENSSGDPPFVQEASTNPLFGQTGTNYHTGPELAVHTDPYTLGDVTLYAIQGRDVFTIDPFAGGTETRLDRPGEDLDSNFAYGDLAMRVDGLLFSIHGGDANNDARLRQIDTGTQAESGGGGDGVNNDDVRYYSAMAFLGTDPGSAGTDLVNVNSVALYAVSQGPGFTNYLRRLNPNTGTQLNPGGGTTNPAPVGEITPVDGQVTGMTFVGNTLYAVTSAGSLYTVNRFSAQATLVRANIASTFNSLDRGPENVSISGLAASLVADVAPNVTGYEDILFATGGNQLYAFDTNGTLLPVFAGGASNVYSGLGNPTGIAFSTNDFNLWHASATRWSDAGHGINRAPDESRDRVYVNEGARGLTGGYAYYFGIEYNGYAWPGQPNANDYRNRANVVDVGGTDYGSYNVPGGAHGSLTSNTFSLAGYTATDKPSLYFTYYLETEATYSHRYSYVNSMRDAFRVFITSDGVNWEPLVTNNSTLSDYQFDRIGDAELPSHLTTSGGLYNDSDAYPGNPERAERQRVQEAFDNTNGWRQARVDLGDFAGLDNLQIRFDFSAAGTMDYLPTLRAPDGSQAVQLELLGPSHSTFTVVDSLGSTTFELTSDSSYTAGNVPVLFNQAQTAEEIATAIASAINGAGIQTKADVEGLFSELNDRFSFDTTDIVKLYYGSFNLSLGGISSGSITASNSLTGDEFGYRYGSGPNYTNPGQNNAYEGVYVDDIIIGFAERGEMVTYAGGETSTNFTNRETTARLRNTDPNPPEQTLVGPYQLEVRRGTEYAVVETAEEERIVLVDSFDTNDRLVSGFTIFAPAGSGLADAETLAINDGVTTITFELDNNGVWDSDNVRISFDGTETAAQMAKLLMAAINGADFDVTANSIETSERIELVGAMSIQSTAQVQNLSVAVDPTNTVIAEDSGTTTATVTRQGDTTSDLVVTVTAYDINTGLPSEQVTLDGTGTPTTTVTILAGSSVSSSIIVAPIDDTVADGTQTVELRPSSGGLNGVTDTLDVTDDEVATISLVLTGPTEDDLGNGDGTLDAAEDLNGNGVDDFVVDEGGSTTASVWRNTPTDEDLVVTLASMDSSEVSMSGAGPLTVTIPAGSDFADITIEGLEDGVIDGNQLVVVTAYVPGFTGDGDEDAVLVIDSGTISSTSSVTSASSVKVNDSVREDTIQSLEDAYFIDSDTVFWNGVAADVVAGEWIVDMAVDSSYSADQTVLLAQGLFDASLSGVTVDRYLGSPGSVVVQSSGASLADMAGVLAKEGLLQSIEPNFVMTVQLVPNDANYSELWGLDNTGQTGGTADADIDAPEAWDTTTGSNNVVVAVMDTGVDYTHEDLAANMWVNPGEIASDGIDNDGNGYIDDVYGIDAYNHDSDPMDDHGHGTHVSGTIAAVGDNSIGVVGVNWAAQLMAIKIGSAAGYVSTSAAIEGINYMTMMKTQFGVNVVVDNHSWGGYGYSSALLTAIEESVDAGILFVAAAGNDAINNDSIPAYPASYPSDGIISVAATDHDDALAWFSNYGHSSVDIGAPGVNIYSTLPGNSYGYRDGTSMAAPHITGAAALAFARNPQASLADIRAAILNTGDSVSALTTTTATGGRLNLNSLVDAMEPQPLSLEIVASSMSETGGATTATVTRAGDTTYDLQVSLTTNVSGQVSLPSTVTIPAGETEYTFVISAIDEAIADGTQTVIVTADALGVSVGDVFELTDNDTAMLTVTIADSVISEDAGVGATTGTLTRNTPTDEPLTVWLTSSDTTEATVPSSVLIPAGKSSVTFSIDAVDELFSDGLQSVTITAAAAGLLSGSASLSVQDVDSVVYYNRTGDQNLHREQGQIILQSNVISNSLGYGIVVGPDERDEAPHPGAVRNLTTLNSEGLTRGVVIVNNLLYDNGDGGIQFSGDANSTGAVAAVPFGKIINNTIYGGDDATGIGIDVNNNASPTIANNIIANTSVGIDIDASSDSTVFGANIFQGNDTDIRVGGSTVSAGSFGIVLDDEDPLFVDAEARNFYLADGAAAVDSSINQLDDRASITAVNEPLGIEDSPILAPDRDLIGQLRVDDPTQDPPPGLGSNVFKDRGAIERSDFFGPTVELVTPEDNDGAGIDLDPDYTEVLINGDTVLTQFVLQINDSGAGIDDSTAGNVSNYELYADLDLDGVLDDLNGDGNPDPLVLNEDYLFSYDATNNVVRLTAVQGVYDSGTYVIVLNNTLTGIQDLATNQLQPNQTTGETQFTIVYDAETPTATMTTPEDNDAAGLDADAEIDRIVVVDSPEEFVIQLADGLSGIDDTSVLNMIGTDLVVTYDIPGTSVSEVLTAGEEYSVTYNEATNELTLRVLPGGFFDPPIDRFPFGRYTIELGDGLPGGNDVLDNAGNMLQDTDIVVVIRDLEIDSVPDLAEGDTVGETYSVVLGQAPASDVIVSLTADGQLTAVDDANRGNSFLVFTTSNWNVPQLVRVIAVDDGFDEASPHTGTVIHTISSADTTYNGLTGVVSILITDNDTAGVQITPSDSSNDVSESGTTDTYTVQLTSQPTANVVITLTDDGQVTAEADGNPGVDFLLFTPSNWNVPQTVRVTAVDDGVDEADIHTGTVFQTLSSLDSTYDGLTQSVTINVADNDSYGITVMQGSGATDVTEGGATDTYSIVLDSEPTGDVTITLSGDAQVTAVDDASPGNDYLVFTPDNWSTPQLVRVTAVDDNVDENDPHPGTISHVVASSDPLYDGLVISNVTANVYDNDAGRFVITESDATTDISEDGVTDTFGISLNTQPTEDVVVLLTSDAQLDAVDNANPANAFLIFTPNNWNTTQYVLVTAVDDLIDETSPHLGTISLVASTGDATYSGMTDEVVANITDNDSAGLVITQSDDSTDVVEGGLTDTYTIALSSRPAANVTVTLNPNSQVMAEDESNGSTVLVFTPDNWNVPRVVRVTAVDDAVAELNPHAGQIVHTVTSTDVFYSGLSSTLNPNVYDNDAVGIIVIEDGSVDVTEGGILGQATDYYRVQLASMPTGVVTINLATDGQVSAVDDANPGNNFLVFTATNWNQPQTVRVTAINDEVQEADPHASAITNTAVSSDAGYNGLVSTVVANVFDDDSPGISVTQSGTSTDVYEGGNTDTFSVVLQSQPTATVTIVLNPDSQVTAEDDANSGSGVLVFTPSDWNVPQLVRVSAVDDAAAETNPHSGTVVLTAQSTDTEYNNLSTTVDVNVYDNDTPGIVITQSDGATDVDENGGQDTYTVVLSTQPASDVVITLAGDGQVTAVSDVTSATTLLFTPSNWDVPQTVRISAVDDLIDETDPHDGVVSHTAASADADYNGMAVDLTAAIGDNDVAGITITETDGSTDVSEMGVTDTYSVVLNTQPAGDVTVALNTNGQVNAVAVADGQSTSLVFTAVNWNLPQTVLVTAVDDAVDEADIHLGTVANTLSSGDTFYNGLSATVNANVTDNDVAGLTLSQSDGSTVVSEDGGQDIYTVVLKTQPTADVRVFLNPDDQVRTVDASGQDITVLTFTAANWNVAQQVRVVAVDDGDNEEDTHTGQIIHTTTSSDLNYNGLSSILDVSVLDNETAGLDVQVAGTLQVTEGGAAVNYSVVLTAAPLFDVTVDLQTGSQITAVNANNPTSDFLVFTPENWSVIQRVRVTAVNDDIDEGTVSSDSIIHTASSKDANYDGLVHTVAVEVTDDDVAGFVLEQSGGSTDVAEGGATDSYTLRLNSQPTQPVSVTLGFDAQQLVLSPTSHTFNSTNWNVPVSLSVQAVDDVLVEGLQVESISHSVFSNDPLYSALAIPNVSVNVTDNDVAPVLTSLRAENLGLSRINGITMVTGTFTGNPEATFSLVFEARQTQGASGTTITTVSVTTDANGQAPVEFAYSGSINGEYLAVQVQRSGAGGPLVAVLPTALIGPNMTSTRAFLSSVYNDLLGRDGTLQEFLTLEASGQTRAQIVAAIVGSAEFDAMTTTDIFQKILQRDPSSTELSGGTNLLQSGQSNNYLRALVYATDEFYNNFGNGNDSDYVTAVYQSALNRAPSAYELQEGTLNITEGGRRQAVQIVLDTAEFRTLVIQEIYQDYLGRSATQAEVTAALAQLSAGGTEDDLVTTVVASDEYWARQLVQGVYLDYLQREATTTEISAGVANILAGTSENEFRAQVLGGAEFFSNAGSTNQAFVADAYRDILGREASTSEIANGVSDVLTTSRLDFALQLLGTEEYADRTSGVSQGGAVPSDDLFADDFDRSDATNIGTAWTEQTGDVAIQGSQLEVSGTATALATANGVSVADVVVEATVQLTGDSWAGLVARHTGPGDTNMYLGALIQSGSSVTGQIWRNVGGTWSMLASGTASSNTGLLSFSVVGDSLTLSLGSTVLTQVADAQITSAGTVGVRGVSGAAWDNFRASVGEQTVATLPFNDSFTGSNGDALGASWVDRLGDFSIQSGAAQAVETGLNITTVSGVNEADVSISATVTLGSTNTHAGLVARYSGAGDGSMYLGALVNIGGANSAQIWRSVNGVWSLLATAPVSSSSGILAFEVVGSSLSLSFGGSVVTGATDTALTSAGQVGMRALGGNSYDNFSVQEGEEQAPADLQVVSGSFTEQGNVLTAVGSGTNLGLSTSVTASDVDLQATITVQTTGNSHAGMVARYQASGNMYLGALVGMNGSYSLQIWKCVGGTWSQLSAATVSSNTGVMRFVAQGSNLSLYLDGNLIASAVDSDILGAGQTGYRGSQGTTYGL